MFKIIPILETILEIHHCTCKYESINKLSTERLLLSLLAHSQLSFIYFQILNLENKTEEAQTRNNLAEFFSKNHTEYTTYLRNIGEYTNIIEPIEFSIIALSHIEEIKRELETKKQN